MAGTIVADDLKHSNNDTVGTEYIINGAAKAWLNFADSGTASINTSFNLSSITDVGTAEYQHNWTNTFDGDASYAVLACGVQGSYDLSFETNALASYANTWLSVGGTDRDNALGQASVTATGDLA